MIVPFSFNLLTYIGDIMSLNLGDVVDVFDEAELQDLLVETDDVLMDLDQAIVQTINIENAQQIIDTAKASNSAECLQFAQELLGVSLEVDLPKATVKTERDASEELQKAMQLRNKLLPKVKSTFNTLNKLTASRAIGNKHVIMSSAMLRIAHRLGIAGTLTVFPIKDIHNIIQKYKNFDTTLRERIAQISAFDMKHKSEGLPPRQFLAEERERVSRLRDFLALGLYLIRALRTSFKGKDGKEIKSKQQVM